MQWTFWNVRAVAELRKIENDSTCLRDSWVGSLKKTIYIRFIEDLNDLNMFHLNQLNLGLFDVILAEPCTSKAGYYWLFGGHFNPHDKQTLRTGLMLV